MCIIRRKFWMNVFFNITAILCLKLIFNLNKIKSTMENIFRIFVPKSPFIVRNKIIIENIQNISPFWWVFNTMADTQLRNKILTSNMVLCWISYALRIICQYVIFSGSEFLYQIHHIDATEDSILARSYVPRRLVIVPRRFRQRI